jgi:RNA polymerase sigma-70 factor, ECF subfamily
MLSADQISDYQSYLQVLARVQLNPRYRAKLSASDLVQQTMMQAVNGFGEFQGKTEAELRGWLRQILARNLAHLHRDLHRDKRDIDRERSIEDRLHQSSMRLEGLLAGNEASPSQQAITRERVMALAGALERLPESQRDAVRLYYLEGLKIGDVAGQMGRSTSAVAGLLHRGLKALRSVMPSA